MATIYVGSAAAGTADGSSQANKMLWTDMDAAILAAGAGGTVLFVSTDTYVYTSNNVVPITQGGTAGSPVRITSTDTNNPALITANRTTPWPAWAGPGNVFPAITDGRNVFRLDAGANYLTFDYINWKNVGYCVQANATITGLTLADMTLTNIRQLFRASGAGNIQTGTFQRIKARGFTKGFLQFAGTNGSTDVLIEDVYADSEFQDGDPSPVGIQMGGNTRVAANKRFRIRRCTFKNLVTAYDSTNGPTYERAYYQGDGITTEEHDEDILIEYCRIESTGDGGLDAKGARTVVRHSVFRDCKRSIRKHPSQLDDNTTYNTSQLVLYDCTSLYPFLRGGSGVQSHINSTDIIMAIDCTLFDDSSTDTAVFNSEEATHDPGEVHVIGGTITKKTAAPLQDNDAQTNGTPGAGATLNQSVTIVNVP